MKVKYFKIWNFWSSVADIVTAWKSSISNLHFWYYIFSIGQSVLANIEYWYHAADTDLIPFLKFGKLYNIFEREIFWKCYIFFTFHHQYCYQYLNNDTGQQLLIAILPLSSNTMGTDTSITIGSSLVADRRYW